MSTYFLIFLKPGLNSRVSHSSTSVCCVVQVFIEEVGKQRLSLSETLRLGDDILSKAHQEAVPIMKKWLIILRQHMDNVDTWSANFEKSIQVPDYTSQGEYIACSTIHTHLFKV